MRAARAFLSELSEPAWRFIHEITGSAFATMRQRVACHLLDLASERGPEPEGSSWSRSPSKSWPMQSGRSGRSSSGSCASCARRGSVRTERDRIVLTDAARLMDERRWNASS